MFLFEPAPDASAFGTRVVEHGLCGILFRVALRAVERVVAAIRAQALRRQLDDPLHAGEQPTVVAHDDDAAAPAVERRAQPRTARRVEKPWGWEIHWTPADRPYVGKVLHIRAGKRLSLQMHDEKLESWFLMTGRAKVVWDDGTTSEGWLALGEAQATTDAVAAEVARRLLHGRGRPGAFTPAALFGSALATDLGGTWTDTEGARA